VFRGERRERFAGGAVPIRPCPQPRSPKAMVATTTSAMPNGGYRAQGLSSVPATVAARAQTFMPIGAGDGQAASVTVPRRT
jgi:hypothetical protein